MYRPIFFCDSFEGLRTSDKIYVIPCNLAVRLELSSTLDAETFMYL